MKYVLFRLVRSPMFWAFMAVNLVVVLWVSVDYKNNARDMLIYWHGYIEEYKTMDELHSQKEALEQQLRDMDSLPDWVYSADEKNSIKEDIDTSLQIINYLLEKESPWGEYVDGRTYAARAYERRSYIGYMWEQCMGWQGFLAVILLAMIVNAAYSNGTYASEIVLYGRKQVFRDQMICCLFLLTLIFALQAILTFLIGTQYPRIGQKYLFYTQDQFRTFSPTLVMVMQWIGLYVNAWPIWGMMLLLSTIIRKIVPFLLGGAILAYLIASKYMTFDWNIYRFFFHVWPENYWADTPIPGLVILYILRMMIGIGLTFLAYVITKKRIIALRYE